MQFAIGYKELTATT